MKRLFLVAGIFILCIATIYIINIFGIRNTNKNSNEETYTEEVAGMDDFTYIKENINTIIQSKEYKAAEIDSKVKLLQPVLDKLIEDGYVSEYQYNPKDVPPSIYLKYSEGGGVSIVLEEFSQKEN